MDFLNWIFYYNWASRTMQATSWKFSIARHIYSVHDPKVAYYGYLKSFGNCSFKLLNNFSTKLSFTPGANSVISVITSVPLVLMLLLLSAFSFRTNLFRSLKSNFNWLVLISGNSWSIWVGTFRFLIRSRKSAV